MASTITRRPLPALVSLLALLVLTAVVWLRVMNRDSPSPSAAPPSGNHCSSSSGGTSSPAAQPKTTISPAAVTVQVLNSTDRSGIAATARTALIAAGFKVPAAATNDAPNVSITQSAQIRYAPADAAGARLLQYYFPGSVLSTTGATAGTVVVSLGDAYTGVAGADAVKAAMASGAPAPAPAASGSAGASPSPSC